MSERVSPIRSELLAAKIEKLLNFELPDLFDQFTDEPRFLRALWFLEYVSKPHNYAGGLTKFAEDFIAANLDQIGTPTMLRKGEALDYSADEAGAILEELRERHREELLGEHAWLFENAVQRSERGDRVSVERIAWTGDGDDLETWEGTGQELAQILLDRVTPPAVREICRREVSDSLASYFKQVCELPHVGFLANEKGTGAPSYFSQVGETLLSFIERRAESLRPKLAETEVTQLVFRWMRKARTMRRPIMLSGNSRFGKTEAVKLLSEMEPHNFRLVNTPASNAIGDLFREVARSLGIEVAAQNSVRDLRERIEYVLRFANLVLCFDEFQAALPATFSRNTAPARLNWVRRSVMDQGLAAVFICTPQSYLPAKRRFVKTTGFAMEQFDERILKTVELPSELSEADLLGVAKIHFADLAEGYLQVVVRAALATERNFVSDIEKIATLAKDNAREQGRARPLLCDIEAAIADVLPTPRRAPAPVTLSPRSPIAAPVPSPSKRVATPLPASRISSSDRQLIRRDLHPLAVKT